MKLYLKITKMTFDEDLIEHNIIRGVLDKEFAGYDEIIELSNNNKFIKDTLKIIYKKDKDNKDTKEIESKAFIVREQETWWGYPLYEFKDGKIIPFNWKDYSYFLGTDRRNRLAAKINELYNPPAEAKILRKTLKYIMNELKLKYPDFFDKMNTKIEEIINKNPKDKIK